MHQLIVRSIKSRVFLMQYWILCIWTGAEAGVSWLHVYVPYLLYNLLPSSLIFHFKFTSTSKQDLAPCPVILKVINYCLDATVSMAKLQIPRPIRLDLEGGSLTDMKKIPFNSLKFNNWPSETSSLI